MSLLQNHTERERERERERDLKKQWFLSETLKLFITFEVVCNVLYETFEWLLSVLVWKMSRKLNIGRDIDVLLLYLCK